MIAIIKATLAMMSMMMISAVWCASPIIMMILMMIMIPAIMIAN